MPVLQALTAALGPGLWLNTVVALTHAGAAPPAGRGGQMSYNTYAQQRNHLLQVRVGGGVLGRMGVQGVGGWAGRRAPGRGCSCAPAAPGRSSAALLFGAPDPPGPPTPPNPCP
jgi:hypothetical protein